MAEGQGQSANLRRLADSVPQSKDKLDDVYLAVATLFEHQKSSFAPNERKLAADILRHLSKDVEMSIRITLAERLATNEDAPQELILLLADDRIEVARPVLARSPVLSDDDLLHVIERGTTDHQIAVAERPAIGESVSAALARLECEAVLIALLRNATAKISHMTFDHLVGRARNLSSLHEPLAGRPDLPPVLASRMYVWVSNALKTALLGRYPHITQSLAVAIDESAATAQDGKQATSAENAKKLIDKLVASGQLKPSFLVRVLHQGQMELFEQGFAALLKMDVETLRKAFYGDSPETVALACRAAGIDRSVFMTVFNLSRHHRRLGTKLSDSEQGSIQAVFNQVPKTEALNRLKSTAA